VEISIGSLSQIPPGEGRNFDVGEIRVAVFHLRDGSVRAVQSTCPHRGGPLADGLTDDAHVICPLHDRIYDLNTGAELGTECRLKVYPVRTDRGGSILINTVSLLPLDRDDQKQ
jgi:nitrite reductase (NADH) small subunit